MKLGLGKQTLDPAFKAFEEALKEVAEKSQVKDLEEKVVSEIIARFALSAKLKKSDKRTSN